MCAETARDRLTIITDCLDIVRTHMCGWASMPFVRCMHIFGWRIAGSKVFLQSPHRKKVPLHHADSFNAPWFRIKRICSYYDIILMTHEFLMRAVGNITARVNCKRNQEPGRSLFFFLRLLLELVLLANARYACVHTHV